MEERCSKNMTRNHQNFQYREYMPSVWQVEVLLLVYHILLSCVSHTHYKILLRSYVL